MLSFFSIEMSMAAEVRINGVNDKEIIAMIKNQITSNTKYNLKAEDSLSNKFRLEADEKVITTILRSFGYFDAEVHASGEFETVTFDIILNERYKFNEVLLRYKDDKEFRAGLKIGQVFDLVNIEFDSYTTTKQISVASVKICDFFKKLGFAFIEINQPIINIDKKNKKIKATYEINLNKKIIIDKTIIKIKSKKDPKLLEPFVRNRLEWKDGDVYDSKLIESTKELLMDSGIFASIEISLEKPTTDLKDEKLAHTIATVELSEALLRDIAVGVKYGTTEKLGILLSWTHYNVNGKGSKFTTLFDMSNLFSKKNREMALKLQYSAYDIFYRQQELKSQTFYTKAKTDSYDVSKIGVESMLWQNFGRKFKLGLGACVENASTTDKINPSSDKQKSNAFGIPIGISLDTTDSFFDPQKGIRCNGMMTPYFGKINTLDSITVLSGKCAAYLPISKNSFKNSAVIAFYAKSGSIFSKDPNAIPRDRLFFGGGANSIRGYGYQKLGKINNDKSAFGGESIFEIGVEPRLKISDDVGVVVFAEGGNVFSSKIPKPMKNLLWGYGFGVRYYTPLGPIRLDIAFPTKIRKTDEGKRIDSRFNIYVSIGQAF